MRKCSVIVFVLAAACGGGDDGGGAIDAPEAIDAPIDADPTTLPHFSFFVSLKALQELSNNPLGFGGDLRFGETGPGAGLRGADKLCATIAERRMPGAGAKPWRAFLSASDDGAGNVVHAIDRIGPGPWYDRNGRLLAPDLASLMGIRPAGRRRRDQERLPQRGRRPQPRSGPDRPGRQPRHVDRRQRRRAVRGADPDLPRLDRQRRQRGPRGRAPGRALVAARQHQPPDQLVDVVAHRVGLRARGLAHRDGPARSDLEHRGLGRRLRRVLLLRVGAVRPTRVAR
jgi:hypothetical protein